ncbi:MAG: AI-2E family transporter [Candidatus Nomurabacteria bacterium]|jgi:predicted PurR-regulated permease PerM|nr:AI-2E family transporter [Candidatus Nomurabacteria bacterium]
MKKVKLVIDTNTFVRFWLVSLSFVAAIAAIWLACNAIIMVLVAFFLAIALNRPVSFIARHLPGKSRVLATLLAYVVVVAIILLLFFNVVPIFVEQIAKFLEAFPQTIKSMQEGSSWFSDLLVQYNLESSWSNWLRELQTNFGQVASGLGGSFVGILNGLVNTIINIVFVVVLTFFMLIEGSEWEKKFWRLVYKDADKRKRHQAIVGKMYDVVSSYVSGQLLVAAITATATMACIAILSQFFPAIQLPLILTAWLVLFLMMLVPMFGAFIGGAVITLLLALYAWPAAIIYMIFLIIEQLITSNIVSPKIQSKRLNVSALIVLVAIIFGLQVAGIFGALVAIPVAGCIMVLVRDTIKRHRKEAVAANNEVDLDSEDPNKVMVFNSSDNYVCVELRDNKQKKTDK